MKDGAAKMFFAAAAAAVWSYAQDIVIPFCILVAAMCVDYVSGVAAAWVRHELNSRVGLIGIIKKLSYLALVVVGCAIDYLISMLGSQLGGTEISIRAIGLVVICWLIINELISILENVAKQGGPVPPFLRGILSRLKHSAEAQLPADVAEPDAGERGKHERQD